MRRLFYQAKRNAVLSLMVYLFTTFIFGTIVFSGLDAEMNRSVQYDCRVLMGGWHPDVPTKVLEECRKLKHKGIVYRYDA